VKVVLSMVGKKFGEFALTRRPGKHPAKKGGKKK
jgi:ribosomal protein S19